MIVTPVSLRTPMGSTQRVFRVVLSGKLPAENRSGSSGYQPILIQSGEINAYRGRSSAVVLPDRKIDDGRKQCPTIYKSSEPGRVCFSAHWSGTGRGLSRGQVTITSLGGGTPRRRGMYVHRQH
jgi:hypothetical protein